MKICVSCEKIVHCKELCKQHYMQWFRQKPEQIEKRSKYNREHYINNIDWYKERNDKAVKDKKFIVSGRKYRQENKEYLKFKSRREYPKYKAQNKYRANKRRCKLLKATPAWVDQDALKKIYRNCPEGYHVDHIIPLQANNMSGLHVPWNLQYLPAKQNLSKGNKVV